MFIDGIKDQQMKQLLFTGGKIPCCPQPGPETRSCKGGSQTESEAEECKA
jgi:hypothetical protein